jgi:hypothetical protein
MPAFSTRPPLMLHGKAMPALHGVLLRPGCSHPTILSAHSSKLGAGLLHMPVHQVFVVHPDQCSFASELERLSSRHHCTHRAACIQVGVLPRTTQ